LPRRERKQRDNYDVLVSRNRYTHTPDGWVHEQDNYKLVLKDNQPNEVLARELALHRYNAVDSVDFSPAHAYWQRTSPFWQQVRDAWADIFAKQHPVRLKVKHDDQTLWQHMFDRVNQIKDGNTYDANAGRRFIDETLKQFVTEP
jgi:hypothetical protein